MDTAVILAGGLGTRLRPLTDTTPKPLLPVAGKPTIEWSLELLNRYGFKKAVLAVGYRADQIEAYFGQKYKNLELVYSVEHEALGTGGPLQLAKKYLKNTFVVLNGDNVVDINIVNIAETHSQSGAMA